MLIRPITVLTDEVAELIRQSRHYQEGIYPPESINQDDPETLVNGSMYFIGAWQDDILSGIGGVKVMSDDTIYGEIKNLFVDPVYRGKGLSKMIMAALEQYLLENNITLCRLETGVSQPESIGLYRSLGYQQRGPYGEYRSDPLSFFMEKVIK